MYNSVFSFKVSKILEILSISSSKEDTVPHCKNFDCLLFSGFPVCFFSFQNIVTYQGFFLLIAGRTLWKIKAVHL